MSEPPKTVCETCSGKLNKVIVPIAFHLKGGGWYKDLYASKGKPSESKSTEGGGQGEAKAEAKTETKSETKTETKSETKKDSGK